MIQTELCDDYPLSEQPNQCVEHLWLNALLSIIGDVKPSLLRDLPP